RRGLIEQLTSSYGDGYTNEDAEYAVSYLEQKGEVDWNEQAYKSAKSYLDMTSFSRDGLYDQLTSEAGDKYTSDQANYALQKVGY
ncbi:MAG: Ltp family lipoprotein, partial [Lachnospiraceae bacterium]|nr:Ltp family lipoprotein [Lachnospiraceae bacterium]